MPLGSTQTGLTPRSWSLEPRLPLGIARVLGSFLGPLTPTMSQNRVAGLGWREEHREVSRGGGGTFPMMAAAECPEQIPPVHRLASALSFSFPRGSAFLGSHRRAGWRVSGHEKLFRVGWIQPLRFLAFYSKLRTGLLSPASTGRLFSCILHLGVALDCVLLICANILQLVFFFPIPS